MMKRALLCSALGLVTLGCGAHSTEDGGFETVGTSTEGITLDNGRTLNGRTLNGRTLNGRDLTGRQLVSVSFSGAKHKGRSLRAVRLDGAELVGVDSHGGRLRGKRFEGTELKGTLDDGTELVLHVEEVQRDAGSDVFRYQVSYEEASGPQPLCPDTDGSSSAALALHGSWNYGTGVAGGGSWIEDSSAFTFACEGFALAKCVDLGYRPWETAKSCMPGRGCRSVELADYHQACTRLIRADYCGDGTAHTIDGYTVNLYDALGIQNDSEQWSTNAEWTVDGARCVLHERLPSNQEPACWSQLISKDCGSKASFSKGTLLISEIAWPN